MNRILIVEDEPALANVVKDYLKNELFDVEICTEGDKAIEVFNKYRPSLLILDLMLPGTDGLVVAKTIKQHQEQTRILMMTAKGQLEDKLEGFEV